MSSKNSLSEFSRNLWLTLGMFVVVAITFGFYTYLGKQVDHANELRLQSFLLADELRQSSDDLTRMVRTYVVTGDSIYKQHYQEILDIRDGKKSRPAAYSNIYWDLVLADDQRPRSSGQAVPLLELMRQAGFTEREFASLAQAKANSDLLTRPEFAAMALIESTEPTTEANRLKAIQMLNDATYHQAKYGIMRPISEFYQMVEQRTLEAVRSAENAVALVRMMLIAFGLLLAFTLWRAYRALHATLGCSVDELQGRIVRLGSGDFSSSISVAEGMENSVLGWLSATQINLAQIDAERKLMEEKIRQMNEELEAKVQVRTRQLLEAQKALVRKEKLAVLGQIAGSVGHELRNPLGVMSNAVYFLQTVLTDADETTKEYLDIIKNEISGSERIVSDLLDSVRTKPPHAEIVGVEELINQTLRKLTIPPSVSVKLDIPETLPPLRVDAQQIHQVFRNLISNGAEAMPEGGVLEISAVENKPEKTIAISVRDSGIGMTQEHLSKLFQPLFTTKARGIGLGLVVVKNLTQANGGTVTVESEAGKGTLFTVTLPAAGERKNLHD